MTAATIARLRSPGLRTPLMWGVIVGVLEAASPLAFWWLETHVVYALGLAVIAAVLHRLRCRR
jgi:hypothetical protein